MNMKNLIIIYDRFKNKNIEKEKESLNDIVKGTKSVLANELKFKEYIQSYSKTTERYTFKSPGITEYPIFKKKSYVLIPVKRKKINFYEDMNWKNNENNNEEPIIKPNKMLFLSPKESLYRTKIKYNINSLKTSRQILRNKLYKLSLSKIKNKKERYNTLFLDFFYKWNKNNQMNSVYNENCKINSYSSRDYIDCSKNKDNNYNTIENIKSENYSELIYDDNKIFNQDYTKFINERIEYIKNNTIENIQEKLVSVFDDINGKEIKLKLESVKINFKPLKNKYNIIKSYNPNNLNNQDKTIILYIPLYYAFLICHKNLNLFRHILMSSITFSNDFETITFNDKIISSLLKDYNIDINNSCKIEFNHSKKNINPIDMSPKKNYSFRKLATKNYSSFGSNAFTDHKAGNINPANTFTALKNNFVDNLSKNNNKKKEAIFHSNIKRNTLYNSQYLFENNNTYDNNKNEENKNLINNNNSNYNEFIFLWETYSKTFLVTIQMPMIYFKYKNLKNELAAFCDNNLFLYIYKKNFINWDYYVLNFLFSIKAFRKIILNNYSINKKYILNDLFSRTTNKENSYNPNNIITFRNKGKIIKNDNERYNYNLKDNKKYESLNETIIINKNKNKIYNIMNENNESYLFFYTDDMYNNSIIKFYSYLIIIDYEKLNPKLRWKYYLDFKKMKLLNEITKYESLDSFLPKIIQTDFQNGFLSMDFSLFDEFDVEVLGYEKKNIIKKNKIKTKTNGSNTGINNIPNNKELCIDIKFPFIKVEKIYTNNNNIDFRKNIVDLDLNFLQKINDYKINSWSKKIIEILNKSNDNLINSTHLSPGMISKDKNNVKMSPFSISSSGKNVFSNSKKFLRCASFNINQINNNFH